jgi:glucose/arabinose dehydrogenase
MRTPIGRSLSLTLVVLACGAAPAHAVTVRPGFTATPIVEGLDQPTAADFAPDGRLVILEKTGAVRLWTAGGGLRAAPLLTLPVCTDSEMGLLGLAFHPSFVENGFVYLYHTMPPGGDPARCSQGVDAGRRDRVVRVTLGSDTIDPASLVVIVDGLRTDGGNHDGGVLRFGPDGMLYVGVGDTGIGDGGAPGTSTNPYAHDLSHREGKILRVKPNGDAPDDNPFVAMGGDAAFVWAYGFRNPFRFAFDPILPGPQHLWVGDVGQSTWEEVDVVEAGDDLGWPACEGFAPAGQCPGSSIPPIYVYRHPGQPNESVSITGGVHYDGTQFDDSFHGDYFFGDFGLNQVYRADVNATRDGFDGDPEVFADPAGQPVDFFVGPDGALYWVAIGNGAIIRVTQDGRPGAVIGGCERALARAASTWLTRATKRVARCLAGKRGSCLPAARPPVPRKVRHRIDVACDATARGRVCARLGCVPCAGTRDLALCGAEAAATAASALASPLTDAARGRCRTATVRGAGVAGGDRLDAIVDCIAGGATTCVPPPSDPAPPALGRACASPPADVCTALACAPCASGDEASACVATTVAAPVDDLASALLGVVR